jgi:hypothetical protein
MFKGNKITQKYKNDKQDFVGHSEITWDFILTRMLVYNTNLFDQHYSKGN